MVFPYLIWRFFDVETKLALGLVALIIISVGGFIFLRPTPPPPIKVYSVVTPIPKPAPTAQTRAEKTDIAVQHGHEHDHSHGHLHETVPHSHASEMNTKSGKYDWRDDDAFDIELPKDDPWKLNLPASESMDAVDDTYPPRDWYKTEDLELRSEYFYAQLLKQFGDIPEVHIVGEYELDVARGVPLTLGKIEAYLEANYHLFPNEKTKKAIEDFHEIKALGATIGSK